MICVFGKGHELTINYEADNLTEKDKTGGLMFKTLPPKEEKIDHDAVLYLNENKTLEWKYYPKQKDTLEDLVRKELITREQYKTLTGKDFTF